MKKHSKTIPLAPRGGVFFAPGTVESSKARSGWMAVARECAICLAIALVVGTASAFLSSLI